MSPGWTGRILRVDLTLGTTCYEEIPRQWLEEYLGGRGLGVRLMRDYFRIDPFDPAMPLIFAVDCCAAQVHRPPPGFPWYHAPP